MMRKEQNFGPFNQVLEFKNVSIVIDLVVLVVSAGLTFEGMYFQSETLV